MNYARLSPSFALLAVLFIAIAPPASGEPKEVSEDEITDIAKELSDRFAALNSFQAEYAGVSPTGGEIRIFLHVNRTKDFAILHMIRGPDESHEAFASARLLREDGSIQSFAFLGGAPEHGVSLEITFAEFLGNVFNAAGLFGLLATIAEDEQVFGELLDPGTHGIGIGLGLERSDLLFGLDYTSRSDGISGRWLPLKGNAKKVTAVELSDEYVDFFYPESRVVRVDRATGLLIRDSYPAPGHDSPREMKLVERRDLSEETTMEDLLPAYWKTMPTQEIPKEEAEQLMLREMLSSLGDALAEVDDLDRWLEEGRNSIRESARRHFRNKDLVNVGESEVEGFTREGIWPVYELAVENDPSLNYEKFLDSVLDLNEREDLLDGALGMAELETKWKGYERHLLHLPPEKRRPLAKVYHIILPELAQAYRIELMRHVLEGAKAVRPEEATQTPN